MAESPKRHVRSAFGVVKSSGTSTYPSWMIYDTRSSLGQNADVDDAETHGCAAAAADALA